MTDEEMLAEIKRLRGQVAKLFHATANCVSYCEQVEKQLDGSRKGITAVLKEQNQSIGELAQNQVKLAELNQASIKWEYFLRVISFLHTAWMLLITYKVLFQ